MNSKQLTQHPNYRSKEHSYRTLLNNARRHMTPVERALSHFIHIGIVESISELLNVSFGRPKPLLLASCLGLVATSYSLVINTASNLTLSAIIIGYLLGFIVDIFEFLIKK